MNRFIFVTMLLSLLLACAEIPERIVHPPVDDLQFDTALSNIKSNISQPVRWGGTVITVSEKNGETWIEVKQLGLDDYGAPRQSYGSDGRFLIKTERLPEELPLLVGMDITVYGKLSGTFEGTIGYEQYLFPVVDAKEHYLWGPEYSTAYSMYYPYSHHYDLYPYPSPLYPYSYSSRFNTYAIPFSYGARSHLNLYGSNLYGPVSHRRYRHGVYYYW